MQKLEYDLFVTLREKDFPERPDVSKTRPTRFATVDVLLSLAEVAAAKRLL